MNQNKLKAKEKISIYKKIIFAINFYIDIKQENNNFDHPIILDKITKIPIYRKMLKSLERLKIPKGYKVKFLFFGINVNPNFKKNKEYNNKIKASLESIIINYNLDYEIITNNNISSLPKVKDFETFYKTDYYSDIRNLAFIYANLYNSDLLIQIDDDEIVNKNYVKRIIKIINKNKINAISGFYLENNSVRPSAKDMLDSWPKFKSMQKDIDRIKLEKLSCAIYGKGGNMTFTKKFFSKMLYPNYTTRGEDFSLILSSWCIYKNGNKYAKIKPYNNVFKTYFTSNKFVTIKHFPVEQANKNKLKYIYRNLIRFLQDRNMVLNQKNLTLNEIKNKGYYMYKMISYKDIKSYTYNIFLEFSKKYSKQYNLKKINITKNKIIKYSNMLDNRNLFEEYTLLQSKYINFIKELKSNFRLEY